MPNDADRQAASRFIHESDGDHPELAALFEAHRLAAYQAGQRDMQERAVITAAGSLDTTDAVKRIRALPIKETPDADKV